MKREKVAMTIAGSDSGGGAGLQADLKTFASIGVYGVTVVTSITAQNTMSVLGIHDVPPRIVELQIKAVVEDIGVDAAKTGMLSNSEIISVVADSIERYGIPLVVDPVMIAKSGARLLREDAVETLMKKLIPRATVVTPNRMEAEVLAGFKIKNLDDAKRAAREISLKLGCPYVVVKGGHLSGDEAVDVVYCNGSYREFRARRVINACTHGTGCSFSAAIAGFMALGYDVLESIRRAKEFITIAIEYGFRVGRGHCPVNPQAWIEIPAEKYRVLENLRRAVELLVDNSRLMIKLVPEVRINLVMSLPARYARSENDVAGVDGRITVVKGKLKPAGELEFGASKHMARAVLTIMKYNPRFRSGMNIAYNKEFVEAARKLGYIVSYFDRSEEPPEVKSVEGGTTVWGVEKAVANAGGVAPDIIIDYGEHGKEPLIFIFGENAVNVVEKTLRIAKKAFEV